MCTKINKQSSHHKRYLSKRSPSRSPLAINNWVLKRLSKIILHVHKQLDYLTNSPNNCLPGGGLGGAAGMCVEGQPRAHVRRQGQIKVLPKVTQPEVPWAGFRQKSCPQRLPLQHILLHIPTMKHTSYIQRKWTWECSQTNSNTEWYALMFKLLQ